MTHVSCNCIVCAQEFDAKDLQSVVSAKLNVSRFKICQTCLDKSDPEDDYRQARAIINSCAKWSEAKLLFAASKELLDSIRK
jgi:hypothetical protein